MSVLPQEMPVIGSGTRTQTVRSAAPAARSSRTSSRLRRYRIWIAILLLAGYPMYWLGLRTRMLFKAATILYAIDGQSEPRTLQIYTRMFGNVVETQDIVIPGKNGPIPARMYTPMHRADAPTMVFIHGMTPVGYRDPIMIRLAQCMAQMGLQVVTPDIHSERQMLMRFDEISDIDETVRWAATQKKQKVSLMGVSFSGGLAVTAAAQPGYAPYVKAVLSISGYNDIARLGKYYIQYGEEAPNDYFDPVKPPLESPLFIAIQHMDEMVPAADVSAISKVVLDRLDKQPEKEERDMESLTPEQRKLYLSLQLLDTQQIRDQYLMLIQKHHAQLSAISPHSSIGGLSAPLYLLHGAVDPTIPLSEAEWNVHDAPGNLPVHLFISPFMHHVVVDAYPPRIQRLQLTNYLANMLLAAGLR